MSTLAPTSVAPALPAPRGPIGELLVERLLREPHELPAAPPPATGADPLGDDDLQLALYLLYELHYRSFDGVDPAWEWEPSLIGLRAGLERAFEAALREAIPAEAPADVPAQLREILASAGGPSLSRYLETRATLEQFREFVVHRSAYQLKEADPHSWAIPRLAGRAKVALVEVQFDEYGAGRADRQHAHLFARVMEALGLDPRYGAYLDAIPGTTLATVNVMSLFGLHRRLRGAIVGHLAALEMDSTLPNRRYGNGLRRLGLGASATDFFDEHVEADAVHEALAAHDVAGALAHDDPASGPDILFGARAMALLDARMADHTLAAWAAGESSLRAPAANHGSPRRALVT
ncbi:MAG TPA: iron-containing redox enzyme family protein [Thermoleophilaceae bacterium]|nr:iron-containing redox enzyme family protein [Thermoleophilaceae bacterium]